MDRKTPSTSTLLTKANVVAVLFIAAVVIGAFAVFFASVLAPGTASAGLRALVHDSDGVVHEMPLQDDATLVVSTSEGENTVVVEDGRVFVAQADCDGQDCVHQGALSAPGGQIICLPHRLWIEVVAADGTGEGEMDVEAVAAAGADAEDIDVLSR